MSIERGKARHEWWTDSEHYVNAPGHGHALSQLLAASVGALVVDASDDPLLFAYQLRDRLPKIAGYVVAMEKWSHAVIETTPDQVPEQGARVDLKTLV